MGHKTIVDDWVYRGRDLCHQHFIYVRFPWVAIGLLILATYAASMIDGAGNLPFLRSVHPHERPEMTAVFMTYRDFGQLAPPAVFSIVLRSFELSAVFFAGGIGMLALAGLSLSIPKRL